MAREEVDLTGLSDDELDDDEALRQAIALSLQDQETSEPDLRSDKGEPPAPKAQEPRGGAAFGSLVLDRKAMEEERLRRLASKRPRSSDDEAALPAPKKLATSRVAEKASLPSQPPKPSESHGGGRSSTLQFPNGVVKKTWASGYPRLGDDIKIEEVLRKDDLELAIISSYQWDDEWMMSKLLPGKTKLLLVAFAADDAQKQDMTDNAPSNVKFSFPPMKGFGAMHSKLQVLKFSTHIRIVVPTGNMVPYDWGETGVMENVTMRSDNPICSSPPSLIGHLPPSPLLMLCFAVCRLSFSLISHACPTPPIISLRHSAPSSVGSSGRARWMRNWCAA